MLILLVVAAAAAAIFCVHFVLHIKFAPDVASPELVVVARRAKVLWLMVGWIGVCVLKIKIQWCLWSLRLSLTKLCDYFYGRAHHSRLLDCTQTNTRANARGDARKITNKKSEHRTHTENKSKRPNINSTFPEFKICKLVIIFACHWGRMLRLPRCVCA